MNWGGLATVEESTGGAEGELRAGPSLPASFRFEPRLFVEALSEDACSTGWGVACILNKVNLGNHKQVQGTADFVCVYGSSPHGFRRKPLRFRSVVVAGLSSRREVKGSGFRLHRVAVFEIDTRRTTE